MQEDNDSRADHGDIQRALHRIETHLGLLSRSFMLRQVSNESIAADPGSPSPLTVNTSELPVWLNARDIEEKIGLRTARLKELHQQGYVRKAKLGQERQAASLYFVPDILEALHRIASGYLPRKKRILP